MKKSSQKIKGNNNIQIGVNNAPIIQTVGNVTVKTEIKPDENKHITDKEALKLEKKSLKSQQCLPLMEQNPKAFFLRNIKHYTKSLV